MEGHTRSTCRKRVDENRRENNKPVVLGRKDNGWELGCMVLGLDIRRDIHKVLHLDSTSSE